LPVRPLATALLERAAGGSASEDLSHLSNLLSLRDGRSIELRYTQSKPRVSKTASMIGRRPLSLATLGVLTIALAGCGQTGGPGSTHAKATTKAPGGSGVAMTQKCTTSGLVVWLGLDEGGAAAGSTYYPLELTNISSRRCRLFGFPGVSAVTDRQLGSPAERNRARPASIVNLLPGATAHTVLRIGYVGNFPASKCKPADARGLRVYPPDQLSAAEIPFSFRACSAKGPVFLSVEPIQPGVGIPGR
jgi:hypothetical protein